MATTRNIAKRIAENAGVLLGILYMVGLFITLASGVRRG